MGPAKYVSDATDIGYDVIPRPLRKGKGTYSQSTVLLRFGLWSLSNNRPDEISGTHRAGSAVNSSLQLTLSSKDGWPLCAESEVSKSRSEVGRLELECSGVVEYCGCSGTENACAECESFSRADTALLKGQEEAGTGKAPGWKFGACTDSIGVDRYPASVCEAGPLVKWRWFLR